MIEATRPTMAEEEEVLFQIGDTALEIELQPWTRGRRFGDFVIHDYLGRGGWAHVYEAEHPEHGVVALKVLDDSVDTKSDPRERFFREKRLLERVAHRNVVCAYDAGSEGARPYLALELLRGEDLESILTERGALTVPVALEVMRQVLEALEAVHEAGIVHRDLKPGNLLVDATANPLRVVLIDFGIAHGDGKKLTATGTLVGTPHYLAPEQILGDAKDDPRIDVYAAGVVLYELLSGAPPHDGLSLPEIIARTPVQDAPPLRNVPPRLAAIVAQALQRDPMVRLQSARAFREELEIFALDEGLQLGDRPLEALEVVPKVTVPLELHRLATPRQVAPRLLPQPEAPRRKGWWLAVPAALVGALVGAAGFASSEGTPEVVARAGTAPVLNTIEASPELHRKLASEPLEEAIAPTSETGHATRGVARDEAASSADEPRAENAARSANEATPTDTDDADEPAGMRSDAVDADAPSAEAETSERSRGASTRALLRRARTAHVRGRTGEAVRLYEEAVSTSRRHAGAWRGLGLSAAHAGDHDRARQALRRYLRLAPRAADRDAIQRRLASL